VTCQLLQEGGSTYLDVYKDRFLPGETVSVKCNQGHWFSFNDQQTQKTITCTESGEWNTAATCQEIRCEDPNDPNLKERLQSRWYGGHAYYRCKESFWPTGRARARCTENGWTPNPLCKVPSQCNLPQRVENAVIIEKKLEVYSHGARVTYECRTNYRMEGERIIRCQSGQWSQQTPTCIQIRCHDPKDPNLEERLQSRWYGEYANYQCKEGFRPTADVGARCTENGWTPNPLCKEIRCQDPNDPNLKEQLQSKRIGENALYQCQEGFTPTDARMATCTENGWTPNPLCKEIRCQDPNDPNLKEQLQSKRIGENALYQCQEGFTPTDARMATCTENGWTPNPLCKEIRCQDSNDPNLKEQLQSKRIGENALYQCQEGFTPTDARMATCTENGWTPNPLCKANGAELEKVEPTVVPGSSATTTADSGRKITCGDPPLLLDGEFIGHFKAPHKHGVKVRYACGINFTIEGDVKTCENGQWTGETRCLVDEAELENTEEVEPAPVSGSSAITTA
ncbi:unnamed protein product, partial [Arctogadus glacialis]